MGSARSHLQTFTGVALLCLFWAAGGARPEVRGKVGGAAELDCIFPPSEPTTDEPSASLHVVEWIRRGLDIPVLIRFGAYAPRLHPQYEGRASLVRVTDLRLEDLRLQDGGAYECRILLLDEASDELQNATWTQLSVTAPPTFTETPPPALEALVGSHLSLACVAIGNPTPTITWLKDDSVIPRIHYQEGALSLREVSVRSAGRYACHASNAEGNATRTTDVKVKGPPVIVIPPTSTALNKSQNALLRCQAVADPPNMTYVWQRGGENVHHIESLKSRVKIMVDGTLLITSLIPEDSGNYTCLPSNGLLNPPSASANLTVMHAALALPMPRRTYLPAGMEGVVTCPSAAQPPLLRVDWTKDGESLDLSLYPGWTLTPGGSLLMTTVNDDTAGVYTCTPYNSYGSAGPSGPTDVILQDPPSFSVAPEKQYRREAGGTLLVPCRGNKDPTMKVTWSKVDSARRTSYSVEPNGSLLLQPLAKDHQGAWECSVANRVASVKAVTRVFVLGTSPHAATSLSVSPGVRQANVSWEAGFDGGSAQTFSVWAKKTSDGDDDGRRDWFSVTVPSSSGCGLQVTGLSPATDYQFSVLSHNKMGTGPFSEIAAARTSDPPPRSSRPEPPAALSAQRGSAGVVLRWSLPEARRPPVTGFVLQSRTEPGEWVLHLDEDIGADSSEMLVPGLRKDCVYELRLLSRRGEVLSEPSPSVNVSTMGMEIYPATSRLLDLVPEPLLAGVLGGVGFVCLALALLLGAACVISRRRDRRRRKKLHEPPSVIYKCSSSIKASGAGSPDSVLKTSLLPASILYPTTCSTTTTSSSSQTDCSSFGVESRHHHYRRKQLPSSVYGSGRLTRTTSSPIPSPIEMISRGPDGRFALLPFGRDAQSVDIEESGGRHGRAGVRRSASVHSERENGKHPAFVLSVDLLPSEPAETDSAGQNLGMVRGPYISDQKADRGGFLDFSSLGSNSSLATISHHDRGITPTFPVLPHIRSGLGQPSTNASALVLQMEHERERGNLSHCLKLAQEREELERELHSYTLERGSARDMKREHSGEVGGNKLVWEYRSSTLPHRYPQGNKESFGLSQSSFSSSSVHWGVRPPLTLIPASSSSFESGDFLRPLHPSPNKPPSYLGRRAALLSHIPPQSIRDMKGSRQHQRAMIIRHNPQS
ncbi:protein turtle homolog A [Pseudoliparis swirei]|uniref:protein turtle homolog A n=1 Tax=Pseudoliparis swirei TaxID=2059687 RepID=UPI0024BD6C4F|nr:protein turtle homolog A [Pseudoliparis swirei]XP_056287948.1 protein turtle homolog A [Pseudoliparis swirei]XP_056287949.1 protein turtle homolog A [Pseudoliparis swirei]XP_056287951.1 protein turtle homolog A [Pseudoliparis swirei]XP_056287952.1 protein turtle homolog A [Pseudoliparis swirei]